MCALLIEEAAGIDSMCAGGHAEGHGIKPATVQGKWLGKYQTRRQNGIFSGS